MPKKLILTVLLTLFSISGLVGQTTAFPGAYGWGAHALSTCRSRAVEVLFVTNTTNDITPGSLRYAIENKDGAKMTFIVFRTGGSITVPGFYLLNKSCLYIAGQTAPGGGIQLRGSEGSGFGTIATATSGGNDLVVRYLRLRPGKGTPGSGDALGLNGGSNQIFDHMSISFGNDENIGMWTSSNASATPIRNFTIQNSIDGASLRSHSAGFLMGQADATYPNISRISILGNLFATNSHRNPRIQGADSVEIVNNVMYNWFARIGETHLDPSIDYVRNYFKAGPWSDLRYYRHELRDIGYLGGATLTPSLYLHRNIATPSFPDSLGNQTLIFQKLDGAGNFSAADAEWFRSSRLAVPTVDWPQVSAAAALASVPTLVGASQRLNGDGTWIWNRDSLDTLIVSHVVNGTGPANETENDHQSDWGGFPAIATGTPYTDADLDGLGDAWEIAQCGAITCVDADDVHGERFAIEWFLSGYNLNGTIVGGPVEIGARRRYWLRSLPCEEIASNTFCWPDLSGATENLRAWPKTSGDSAIVITINQDSLLVGSGPLSNPELEDVCTAWSISCDRLRSVEIAGELTVPCTDTNEDLGALAAASSEGATITICAGVHRHASIVPKNGQKFIGLDGAVLSGARILSTWTDSADVWYATGQTQQGQVHGSCTASWIGCQYPEDVFIDNEPLLQVTLIDSLSTGRYFFNYTTDRIYIADDPAGHVVETSVTRHAFEGDASDVEIRNLTVEKYANPAQHGAIHSKDGTNGPLGYGWLVVDAIVKLNHGVGIVTGDSMTIQGSDILTNGQLGIGGGGDKVTIQSNEIAYNNTQGFSWGWEGGGTKSARTTDLRYLNNFSHHNNGAGLWTDIDNHNTLYDGNIVEDNFGPGIFHEISYNAIITGNQVRRNDVPGGDPTNPFQGHAGILVSASGCPTSPPVGYVERFGSDGKVVCVEVYGNVLEGNPGGITAIQQARGTGVYGEWRVTGFWVHDNTVSYTSGRSGVFRDDGNNTIFGTAAANRFDFNSWGVASGTDQFHWNGQHMTWAEWQAAGMDANGELLP